MDQQNHSSNPSLNPRFSTTVKQAASFLQNIDNTKKTWRGLSYPDVFDLVKNFVQSIEPESNLENISVENLTSLLDKIFAEEEHLESIVPQNLQALLQELEEAEGKAKIFEQKASQKVEDFLERKRVLQERRQKQKPFIKATEELVTTTVRKFNSGLPIDKQELVIKAIIDELAVQTGLKLSLDKASNLPPEERQKEEKRIVEQIHNTFKEALPLAVAKLRDKGTTITPEEEVALSRIIPSPQDLPLVIQQLILPASERKEMSSWFKDQLTPLAPSGEVQTIAEIFVPALVEKLPEIDSKTIEHLSEKQFAEIQTQFEEAAIATLAEVAPEIGEIPPQKINKFISNFIPQNKGELGEYSSVLTTVKENRVVIIPSLRTEPVEVIQLPTKIPRFFAPPFRLATEGNILRVKNEQGIRFVDEMRVKLSKEGINRGNSFGFRNKALEHWALYLTAEKITPEDIDYTIEKLLSAGEKEDSLQIKELKETRLALAQFQQTLPLPVFEKIKKEGALEGKKGGYPVRIPSRFSTTIIRKTAFDPKFNLATRINSFFGKVFGKQTINLSSGQTVYINKIAFLGHQFSEAIKTRFFSTTIGQGIKTALYQLGQNSLQTLWTTAKTGLSTGIKKGVSSILVKVGLHAVAGALSAGIANVVVFIAPKLIKGAVSLVKKVFGIFGGLSAMITGQREVPEDKNLNFVKYIVFGLLLMVLPGVAILNIIGTGGAFLQSGSGGPGEEFHLPPGAEPNCPSPRHLAERVICVLSTGDSPCNNNIVNERTWDNVSSCLTNSSIPGKEIIRDKFQNYLLSLGGTRNLQCVGFVVGIEAGLGRNIERPGRDANGYLNPPYPEKYQLVQNPSDVAVGDAAVWQGTTYGHIAIVIEVIKDPEGVTVKIVIAQSDGYNGEISIREEVSLYSPSGFLTYTQ